MVSNEGPRNGGLTFTVRSGLAMRVLTLLLTRRWLLMGVFAAGFWAMEAVTTWSIYSPPTQAQAKRDLDIATSGIRLSGKRLEAVEGKAPNDPAVRAYTRLADSLFAIRFDDIRVSRPLIDWLIPGSEYLIRTLQTDPGGSPRVRYYLVDEKNVFFHEVSGRARWLGVW